jgi:ADP-ribose pyrophosphatase
MDKFFEKTISSKKIYNGKVFDVLNDEVELSDGTIRAREVVLHPGGVVIAAQKEDSILLVKQYRYPVKQTQLELPAGRLEVNENPLFAAKRELLEETGHTAEKWEDLGFIYTSPGVCSEKLYLYKASCLHFVKQQPDEGEIIDFFEFKIEEVLSMVKNGEINDSKTICALMRLNL